MHREVSLAARIRSPTLAITAHTVSLAFDFDADFADIFEYEGKGVYGAMR